MQTDKENIKIDESNNITQDSNKTCEQIEAYLNGVGINKYEKSQFSDYKIIGRGGSAIVYKATLQGQSNYIIQLKLLYGINHPNMIKFNGILEAKSTVEFIINNVTALDHQAKTPLTESLIFINNALKESKTNICDYNDFTILDKIGGSNSGYVEKARWKSHECIVALKKALEDLRAIKKSGILETLPVEQKINTKNLPKDYKSVSPISAHKNVKFLDQMESSEQIEINQSVLINDEHFKLISKWINKTPPKTRCYPPTSNVLRWTNL
ncbi:15471_t:CDS:2 [Gigaspora margarita]|uniref:15471_t:CDS:1 n=1 Tax=Gigaspora margarita TaxID=4874 RepID=A0ABN7UUL0_GIGMA|nr:15471_t:CDS:2 [Gigaspora margarita]